MGGDEKNGGKKLQKSYFDVLGLCCSSEIPLIEKILKPLQGVKDVTVIVPSRTVIVVHDTLLVTQLQIVKALNQARLEANIRVYGAGNFQKKWPSPLAVICGVLLLLSFLKYVYRPFQWLAVGAVAVGILPIVLKAVAAIRNATIEINILALIAVGGSLVLNDYWEAATIVFLFTTAQWLESRASHKATAVMSSLMNMVPQKAVLAESGEEIDVDEVKLNTVLAVKAGEIIPIDGIVVDGNCEVDEKTLTGESFPVAKQKDSTVFAGTINLNGYISVKTTAVAEECVVARMAKLVEEAQKNKSRTQRFIDRCAKYYTPAVMVIAICVAVIPAALKLHNPRKWYHLALVVLVSGCPCALILSTPVATFCALSKAATSGLLIKGAENLETLASIKIMAFDKTGTITRGEFVVTEFRCLLEDVTLNTLLYWVSSIESKSSHPMAAALIDHGYSNSIGPKPEKVEEFLNFPGEGIYGKIDGKDIYIGNKKIAARAGCATVPSLEGDDTKGGKSIGYIFMGSSPAGIFCLSDVCRSGVKEAMRELKSMGIRTAMLTGDCQAAADQAQNQLQGALDAVHAELLPEDKARIIKEFQRESPTAMIGDGVNDAPALATADIGISMGVSGSSLVTETGQIILMSNDIRKIPQSLRLAHTTRRKVIENMVLSVVTKVAILGLAIAGHPLVWAAVLADVGTCLLVILNSMTILRGTHKKRCCKSSAKSHGHKHKHNHGKNKSEDHMHDCQLNHCKSTHKKENSGFESSGERVKSCCEINSKIEENQVSLDAHKQSECRNCVSSEDHTHGFHEDHCCKNDTCGSGSTGKRVKSCCQIEPKNEEKQEKLNAHKHCGNSSNGGNECKESEDHTHGFHEDHCHKKETSGFGSTGKRVKSCCQIEPKNEEKQEKLNAHRHCGNSSNGGNECKKPQEISSAESLVKKCCEFESANDEISPENHEDCADCKRGCWGVRELSDEKDVGSGEIGRCVSLENRQIGGCCQSFRKECCGKMGHFGLSEIVIE